MKKIILSLVCMSALMAACTKSEIETPNGFKVQLARNEEGPQARPGQFVVFNYVIKDANDSVWMSSFKEGFPGAYKVQDSSALNNEIGMQQVFRMVTEGDSIVVQQKAPSFFKNVLGTPMPRTTDSTMEMTCNLVVEKILDQDKFQEYQIAMMEEKAKNQKLYDADAIEKYLKEKNIETLQDTSGIRYVVYNENGKEKPTVNNCVEVKYRGRFLESGEIFDQNDKLSFPLQQVIAGWQIGIPKLGVGDSATFFIPSGLAYGPRGRRTIPPNSILVFDVTLLDILEYDSATRSCK